MSSVSGFPQIVFQTTKPRPGSSADFQVEQPKPGVLDQLALAAARADDAEVAALEAGLLGREIAQVRDGVS